jgi:hypothetical protein
VIPPLSKEVFFQGIGIGIFFLGWGLTQRVIYWVAQEGEVWFFLKQEGGIVLTFHGIILLVMWDGVFGGSRWVFFFCSFFFFCDMVIY